MAYTLDGKVTIVTGVAELVEELRSSSAEAMYVALDLADEASIKAMSYRRPVRPRKPP